MKYKANAPIESAAQQEQHQSARSGHCVRAPVNTQDVFFRTSSTRGGANSASPIGRRSRFGKDHSTSAGIEAGGWLALRAAVLRRAVSQSARPRPHRSLAQSSRAALLRPANRKGQCSSETHCHGSTLLQSIQRSRNFAIPLSTVQCNLTIRSTGPIAAGRHLGYKSLAQMPARHNGPVSSNVRLHNPHLYTFTAAKYKTHGPTEFSDTAKTTPKRSLRPMRLGCRKYPGSLPSCIRHPRQCKQRRYHWPSFTLRQRPLHIRGH